MGNAVYATGMTHDRILTLVEAAIADGVKEIHVGWTKCGICGEELDDVEDTEVLRYEPQPRTVIHLHLCPECHRACKRAGRA